MSNKSWGLLLGLSVAFATGVVLGSSTPAAANSPNGGSCDAHLEAAPRSDGWMTCNGIIASCRAAGGASMLVGCVRDIVGTRCNSCL